MELTKELRITLYYIIWLEPAVEGKQASQWADWAIKAAAQPLQNAGLIKIEDGRFVGTEAGRALLSPLAQAALGRPKDYADLPARRQWEIDGNLGVLDWDGS